MKSNRAQPGPLALTLIILLLGSATAGLLVGIYDMLVRPAPVPAVCQPAPGTCVFDGQGVYCLIPKARKS